MNIVFILNTVGTIKANIRLVPKGQYVSSCCVKVNKLHVQCEPWHVISNNVAF